VLSSPRRCSSDSSGIANAYVTNANSLVKVYHCQKLIADELRRIAEECLKAKAQILIPYYGEPNGGGAPLIGLDRIGRCSLAPAHLAGARRLILKCCRAAIPGLYKYRDHVCCSTLQVRAARTAQH
jgi:hypothetical protein